MVDGCIKLHLRYFVFSRSRLSTILRRVCITSLISFSEGGRSCLTTIRTDVRWLVLYCEFITVTFNLHRRIYSDYSDIIHSPNGSNWYYYNTSRVSWQ